MMSVARNTKHLAAGSICPSTKSGLLRIYSMFYCPFAQRTRIVLNAKKVKHETINVHLQSKPDWLFKMNPLAKVPILQLNGKVMVESMATCDYLDDAFPGPPLYPADPWAKGVDKGLIEVFGAKVILLYHRTIYRIRDNREWKPIMEEAKQGLDYFEKELIKRGTKFFYGDKPGMIDYAIFPWFERFPIAKLLYPEFDALPKERFPRLSVFSSDMHEDQPAKSTIAPLSDHIRFTQTFVSGKPDYNIGAQIDSHLHSMPRNIEIKAKIRCVSSLCKLVKDLANDDKETILEQEDTFFNVPNGRLKLRKLEGKEELIFYNRPDTAGPKLSDFKMVSRGPGELSEDMKDLLTAAFGVKGVIRKRRVLIMVHQTRVHIDQVEGLGSFMELEVVLRDDQTPEDGETIAKDLIKKLNIGEKDLIEKAYLDLLLEQK